MIAFLTSTLGGSYLEDGKRIPCELNRKNKLLDKLKKYWQPDSRCLIISSDPDDIEMNDRVKSVFMAAFSISGLPFLECDMCDCRNGNISEQEIKQYEVIILAGGHVPTQNRFFSQLQLREKLRNYQGILIGISAGSMNSADVVYAQPELPGEAIDPAYQRFLSGLGITDLMIIPHYQDIKDEVLDEKRVIEDITFTDSVGKQFYVLTDGSYILISGQETRIYGEAYLIADGEMKLFCKDNEPVRVV